jgi:hypothetical protein
VSVAYEIKRLFFQNNVVKYKSKMEGQECKERCFFLGSYAGPEKSIESLLHEVGHFAELEKERLAIFPTNGWGLKQGRFWQIGVHWGYEPCTDQQVLREARVWAFQLSAQRHFNLRSCAKELVSSAVYLPAWCLYKRKTVQTKPHDEHEALDTLARHVDGLTKNYTFERLVCDYHDRVKYLEKIAV